MLTETELQTLADLVERASRTRQLESGTHIPLPDSGNHTPSLDSGTHIPLPAPEDGPWESATTETVEMAAVVTENESGLPIIMLTVPDNG